MELATVEFGQPLLLPQDFSALSRNTVCRKAPNRPTGAGARMLQSVSRFYPLQGVENEGPVTRRIDGTARIDTADERRKSALPRP
jgi:hypothetical protein